MAGGGLAVNFIYARCRRQQKLGVVVNPNFMALMYAIYSALFGTLSVVFAKILAVLVSVWLTNKVGKASAPLVLREHLLSTSTRGLAS